MTLPVYEQKMRQSLGTILMYTYFIGTEYSHDIYTTYLLDVIFVGVLVPPLAASTVLYNMIAKRIFFYNSAACFNT